MGNKNPKEIDLKETANAYFKGLSIGYSSQTLQLYETRLKEKFGIKDIKQLKIDYVNGRFSD